LDKLTKTQQYRHSTAELLPIAAGTNKVLLSVQITTDTWKIDALESAFNANAMSHFGPQIRLNGRFPKDQPSSYLRLRCQAGAKIGCF